jgi:hypothetical protein
LLLFFKKEALLPAAQAGASRSYKPSGITLTFAEGEDSLSGAPSRPRVSRRNGVALVLITKTNGFEAKRLSW